MTSFTKSSETTWTESRSKNKTNRGAFAKRFCYHLTLMLNAECHTRKNDTNTSERAHPVSHAENDGKSSRRWKSSRRRMNSSIAFHIRRETGVKIVSLSVCSILSFVVEKKSESSRNFPPLKIKNKSSKREILKDFSFLCVFQPTFSIIFRRTHSKVENSRDCEKVLSSQQTRSFHFFFW